MHFEKGKTYLCDKDIIVNKHLWFKGGNLYTSLTAKYLMGCDHYEHSEEALKEYLDSFTLFTSEKKKEERVSHPSHYTWLKDKCGIEVIDITRHMDFDLGNVLKYILRAGHKTESSYSNIEKEIEDLQKAMWYLQDKINMLNENFNKK